MEAMTTSQVAREAGVNVESIRFYERNGLLPEPPRNVSGYRQYLPDAVKRIQFIREAQEVGFTLKEIKSLLDLGLQAGRMTADDRHRIMATIAVIDRKINDLQAMKRSLIHPAVH